MKTKNLKLKDVIDMEYITECEIDLNEFKRDSLFLQRGEEWEEGGDINNYYLYFGPTEGSHLEDVVQLSEQYMASVMERAGIVQFDLGAGENLQQLYFSNVKEANEAFKRIVKVVKSDGFKIISMKNNL